MKRIGVFVVLFSCSVLAAWAQSPKTTIQAGANSLVLYDDFNGRRLDFTRWFEWEQDGLMLETVRELSPPYQGERNNRRLRMSQQAYSWTGNDEGAQYGWVGLNLKENRAASVVEISFDITVSSAKISDCQSNPSISSLAWAGFVGNFFNYGGQPGQDVGANIQLALDDTNPHGPLRVEALYGTDIASGYQIIGSLPLGKTAKLRVKWDQPNHQFIYQLNKNPEVMMPYNLPDGFPAGYPFKAFWVARGTPNCTATPTGRAMMEAYFDNVYVNAQ